MAHPLEANHSIICTRLEMMFLSLAHLETTMSLYTSEAKSQFPGHDQMIRARLIELQLITLHNLGINMIEMIVLQTTREYGPNKN